MSGTPNPRGNARGPRPRRFTPGQAGLYAFLAVSCAFFAVPLYVMLVTSFKPLDEVRLGHVFAPPGTWTVAPWVRAWSAACSGIQCDGISAGFWNSVRILVPSVAGSVAAGMLTGYGLSFWRPRYGNVLFAALLFGAFVPYQIFLYPMVRAYAWAGINGTLAGLILSHVMFGLPVMTLLFRNYYAGLPPEIVKAARVDGGRFWQIFAYLVVPMSKPVLAVAAILQVTGIWNDYLLGLVFGGLGNRPMTVQLINIVAPSGAEIEYNVNMAATLLTALVPLVVYGVSGRWFVRGIAAGAVKG